MLGKVLLGILLVIPVKGRDRRHDSLDGIPPLPLAARSQSGYDSPTSSAQNQYAEQAAVFDNDAGGVQVVEYVDQTQPNEDSESLLNDEILAEEILNGELATRSRVVHQQNVMVRNFHLQTSNATGCPDHLECKPKETEDEKKAKKNTFWIIFGISMGIMLLLLFGCLLLKCKSS